MSNWGTISSWVAAVLSLGSLGTTLWVRRRDRPEPQWYLPPYPKDATSYDTELVNVGDGDAFRVEVIPINCRIQFRREWSHPSEDRMLAAKGWEYSRTDRGDPHLVPRIAASTSLPLTISWEAAATPAVEVYYMCAPTKHRKQLRERLPLIPT